MIVPICAAQSTTARKRILPLPTKRTPLKHPPAPGYVVKEVIVGPLEAAASKPTAT